VDAGGRAFQAWGSVDTSYQRVDNLFLRPERSSDGIFSLRPGMGLSAQLGARTHLDGALEAEVQRFSRHKDLDDTHHRTSLSAETGRGDFFLNLSAADQITRDRTYTTITELIRRRDRTFSARTGVDREGRQASLSLDAFSRDYEERLDPLDRKSWTAGPFFRCQRGSWAWNGKAYWTQYDYLGVSPRDGDGAGFRAGVEFDPGGAWKAWGGAGVERRAFDGPSLSRFSGGIADAGARWAPGPRLEASFSGAWDASDSEVEPDSGYFREAREEAALAYRFGPKLSLEARERAARQVYADPAFHPDFSGRRRDRVMSASFRGTYYFVERTALWVETSWDRRDSNRDSQEYRSTALTAGLRIEFKP
jgi:hypothetical protein